MAAFAKLLAMGAFGLAVEVTEAWAQAVTTAAVYGTVISGDSVPVDEATVSLINTSNGERWQTVTRSEGHYTVEYLAVGGPYTLEVRAIGFEPVRRSDIVLSLGQRQRVDVELTPAVSALPELAVTATADPWINPGRTGPAQRITDTLSSRLPVRRRDFLQLIYLSPQAAPAGPHIVIAGQPARLNGLQIDGTTNNDLAGYAGGTGAETPASSSGVRTLSVEAIKELQVAAAPYDVRYGNFAAGLINAVTRSGSNHFEGSLSAYFEDEGLTGKDLFDRRAEDFTTTELALAVGGPIVRNRAAFFLDVGLQRDVVPQAFPAVGTDTAGGADSVGIGFRYESVRRFQDVLRNQYGVEPGSFDAEPSRTRSGNLFAKITLQPAVNNRIDLSYNHAHGELDFPGFRAPNEGYELSSSGTRTPGTINGTRATWTTSTDGGLSNELTLARLGIRESCQPRSEFPSVIVSADAGALGAGSACFAGFSNQTLWELTDNFSWGLGRHRLTVGTHGELAHVDRVDFSTRGEWQFNSLDSLASGISWRYLRNVPNPLYPEGTPANFRVHQIGLYAQDQWSPTARLTLTGGLRVDVPFLPTPPAFNPTLLSELGINTTLTPSGNMVWSPRLGFSYDLSGRGAAFLRGGVGLFAGRPAYHWFNSVYQLTGMGLFQILCFDQDVPPFTLDPARQPNDCASTAPVPTPAVVNYFNAAFRFPRNFRAGLGTDVNLPWKMVGTVDLLFIRGVNQYYVTDVNLLPPSPATGEGGRLLYGTFDADGRATPNRRSTAFERVIELRNASGDRSISATAQLQKRIPGAGEVSLAYTYTDSKDRLSAVLDFAFQNIGFVTPLDGSLDARRLATSLYNVPHKITLTGTFDLPLQSRFSLFYTGYSGSSYSYSVRGDANGDRYAANDLMYVPRDAADIALADPSQYAELDQFMESEPCLRSQRGRIMRRNSCREPWVTVVNARISKVFPTVRGQSVELMADLFNALNLFDRDWGVRRFIPTGVPQVLQLVGYDPQNGRAIYDVLPVSRNIIDTEGTRWRLQVGARYSF